MRPYLFLLLVPLCSLCAADYTRYGDSVVADNTNRLYWQDDFSSEKSSEDFDDAVRFCKHLDLDGLREWRLPTFHELFSLTDYRRTPPRQKVFRFWNEGSYWSATPFAANRSRAWTIDFKSGETYYSYKSTNHAVRCVKEMPAGAKEHP